MHYGLCLEKHNGEFAHPTVEFGASPLKLQPLPIRAQADNQDYVFVFRKLISSCDTRVDCRIYIIMVSGTDTRAPQAPRSTENATCGSVNAFISSAVVCGITSCAACS